MPKEKKRDWKPAAEAWLWAQFNARPPNGGKPFKASGGITE